MVKGRAPKLRTLLAGIEKGTYKQVKVPPGGVYQHKNGHYVFVGSKRSGELITRENYIRLVEVENRVPLPGNKSAVLYTLEWRINDTSSIKQVVGPIVAGAVIAYVASALAASKGVAVLNKILTRKKDIEKLISIVEVIEAKSKNTTIKVISLASEYGHGRVEEVAEQLEKALKDGEVTKKEAVALLDAFDGNKYLAKLVEEFKELQDLIKRLKKASK